MAENSKIEWTDHTFNPWMGCTKVSPGCQHCYAETLMDHRYGKVKWGPQGTRVRTSVAMWKKPLKWNKETWRECCDCGFRGVVGLGYPESSYMCRCDPGRRNTKPTRQRVFCASLADVFEDRPELVHWRDELFGLIEQTPNLDWLILTKRPENVTNMIPYNWLKNFPQNIWLGTSVESQKYADERLPHLVNIPAKVRFLSCEPLLGEVNISSGLPGFVHKSLGKWTMNTTTDRDRATINLVICGGESGPHARPMHPDWARSLRDQCQAAGVAFLFKQWGEWFPTFANAGTPGGRIQSNGYYFEDNQQMWKVGKHNAGRLLDGREWNEVP